MKSIEVDEELYRFIAAQTQHIGESASEILRRLLGLTPTLSTSAVDASDTSATMVAETLLEQAGAQPLEIDRQQLAQQKGAVGRFLYLLGELHQHHGAAFSVVLNIKGRDRQYFADSEDALLSSGSSTNPKRIPGSSFWVITNNNTEKKRAMVAEVLAHLRYPEDRIQDFTQLI